MYGLYSTLYFRILFSGIIMSLYDNNNNKKKITSFAPISSENPSSVAHKGLGILVTMYNANSRQQMDGGDKKLRCVRVCMVAVINNNL